MAEFNWSTRVDAPVEEVARFHTRPGLIRKLTPPVTPVTLQRMEPLGEGSIAAFTIWMGFIPIRWTALHVDVDPRSGFTDVQLLGPFAKWRHEHRYEPLPQGGSQIIEKVKYQHQGGWRGLLTRILFARPMLHLLFTYRSLVFRRALRSRSSSSDQITSGVRG